MRLHLENPSEDEILSISNFLTSGNQTELLRPLRVRALIQLSAAEREAIIASMPLCDEWGPTTSPMAPEVAAGGADKDLTTAQRSRLIGRLLVAQEAIEEDEGPDALVCLPRRRLRPSHLASPQASAPGASSFAGASTSRVAPTGSLFPSAIGWDELEWGCLLDRTQ
jgi:hypothetical protein